MPFSLRCPLFKLHPYFLSVGPGHSRQELSQAAQGEEESPEEGPWHEEGEGRCCRQEGSKLLSGEYGEGDKEIIVYLRNNSLSSKYVKRSKSFYSCHQSPLFSSYFPLYSKRQIFGVLFFYNNKKLANDGEKMDWSLLKNLYNEGPLVGWVMILTHAQRKTQYHGTVHVLLKLFRTVRQESNSNAKALNSPFYRPLRTGCQGLYIHSHRCKVGAFFDVNFIL